MTADCWRPAYWTISFRKNLTRSASIAKRTNDLRWGREPGHDQNCESREAPGHVHRQGRTPAADGTGDSPRGAVDRYCRALACVAVQLASNRTRQIWVWHGAALSVSTRIDVASANISDCERSESLSRHPRSEKARDLCSSQS